MSQVEARRMAGRGSLRGPKGMPYVVIFGFFRTLATQTSSGYCGRGDWRLSFVREGLRAIRCRRDSPNQRCGGKNGDSTACRSKSDAAALLCHVDGSSLAASRWELSGCWVASTRGPPVWSCVRGNDEENSLNKLGGPGWGSLGEIGDRGWWGRDRYPHSLLSRICRKSPIQRSQLVYRWATNLSHDGPKIDALYVYPNKDFWLCCSSYR